MSMAFSRTSETLIFYLEHVAITAALQARDPDAARQAMTQHLDRVLAELERRAAENPDIFATSPRPLTE